MDFSFGAHSEVVGRLQLDPVSDPGSRDVGVGQLHLKGRRFSLRGFNVCQPTLDADFSRCRATEHKRQELIRGRDHQAVEEEWCRFLLWNLFLRLILATDPQTKSRFETATFFHLLWHTQTFLVEKMSVYFGDLMTTTLVLKVSV